MLPLALAAKENGATVMGSDRSRDQGQSPEKFAELAAQGIALFPQDGSGVTPDISALIISSAVEPSIPDVAKALELKIKVRKRADLLADLFHHGKTSIGIAGTSGKTTVTGMIATLLKGAGLNPTVINGGRVKNLEEDAGNALPGNLLLGGNDVFVAEMDESDGSIDLFTPDIAVLNNIALDHKTPEELHDLFQTFVSKAQKGAVLNLDNAEVAALEHPKKSLTYAIENPKAYLYAHNIVLNRDSASFVLDGLAFHLQVPGKHNISNALAAIAVADFCGVSREKAAQALHGFTGIRRRLERLGSQNGITVYDDFAHNPDKIAASLKALKGFKGRLIVLFQPHGFAPLRMMGREMMESIAASFDANDILMMPEVYYAGGTVDRSVTSAHVIDMAKQMGVDARWFQTRSEAGDAILNEAQKGDRIVIMGARDDTLTLFARDILQSLSQEAA